MSTASASAPARRSLAPRPVAALDQRVPSRGAGCDHAGRGRSRLRCARAWPPSRASTGSTRPSSAAARPAWPAGRRTPHGSSVGSAWQRILRRCRGCARHRRPLRGSSGCGWVTGRLPGGFRVWWRRLHNNSEEDLDDTHLMRMAGRFSHEWVACQAQTAGIGYTKEGDCFTAVADPQALAQVADTLSQPATAGHLSQVCERWIYSACLCFGLDADEQARSGFRYAYSVYQVEYSRNLLFGSGAQMDRVFNTLVDRTRSRLDVPTLRTLFGA